MSHHRKVPNTTSFSCGTSLCRLGSMLAATLYLLLAMGLWAGAASAGDNNKKDDPHAAHRAANEMQKPAVGWGKLNYPAPLPGTYRLPPIRQLGDGQVVNSEGQVQNLADYYKRDKLTVLGFIYTSCPDLNGCPLATFVMHALKKGLRDNPDLLDRVQLISPVSYTHLTLPTICSV